MEKACKQSEREPTYNQWWHEKNRVEPFHPSKTGYIAAGLFASELPGQPLWTSTRPQPEVMSRAKCYFSPKLKDESAPSIKEIVLQSSVQQSCSRAPAKRQVWLWVLAVRGPRQVLNEPLEDRQWNSQQLGSASRAQLSAVNWPKAGFTSLDPDHIICTHPSHSADAHDANNNGFGKRWWRFETKGTKISVCPQASLQFSETLCHK